VHVPSSFTLFHGVIKYAGGLFMHISHHPRVCEGGAKPPRHSLFIMKLAPLIVVALLLTVSVLATPLWVESSYDSLTLWLTPPSHKALKAATIGIERLEEISTEEDLGRVYAVQELLTVIEQNIDIPGNPHKGLRLQQDVEEQLRLMQERIAILREQKTSDQYTLVLQHASLRIDLLLAEVDLAKEKTKARIE